MPVEGDEPVGCRVAVGENLRDGGRQGRLAVVDMTHRADVQMRLRADEWLLAMMMLSSLDEERHVNHASRCQRIAPEPRRAKPPFPGVLLRLGKGQIRVSNCTHTGATGEGSCRPGANMAITVRGNAEPRESISPGCPSSEGEFAAPCFAPDRLPRLRVRPRHHHRVGMAGARRCPSRPGRWAGPGCTNCPRTARSGPASTRRRNPSVRRRSWDPCPPREVPPGCRFHPGILGFVRIDLQAGTPEFA